ncbi:MAG: phospholipid carrier-dependent glycosyltransferase [Chloroflexi bacterium]|nr:phospholipid carrier-dependent glycosyltransferase [Chloroflexota bacterium]
MHPRSPFSAHPARMLWFLIAAFSGVTFIFSLTAPVLEAPDEPSHVSMIQYIATRLALPVQRPPDDFPAGQEGSQPPLYYALGALLFSLSPAPEVAPDWLDHNPHIDSSRLLGRQDNRNLWVHHAAENFPFQGDVLGIHLARLLSILLGAATIWLTFNLARELFPDRPAVTWLAAWLVAFNPSFVFLSAVVNNDNGITFASTLMLWLLARWLRRGGSTRQGIVLGVALGAALLMKTSGLALVPLVIGALLFPPLWPHIRRLGALAKFPAPLERLPEIQSALGQVGLVLLLALGIAGWWFARNLLLYGDLLGWQAMLLSVAPMIRPQPLDVLSTLRALWDARNTYWAIFGWTNILLPAWVYPGFDLLVGLALAGLAWGAGRRGAAAWRAWLPRLLLVIWPVAVLASLVRWLQINVAADQGRLLFPAIGAIAILLALGLDELRLGLVTLAKRRPQASVVGLWAQHLAAWQVTALILAGAGGNLLVLRNDILPVYRPQFTPNPPLAAAKVRFGEGIELLDWQVAPERRRDAASLVVDTDWRVTVPITRNWSIILTLLDENQKSLTEVRTWPQGGRAAISDWPAGGVAHDHRVLTPRVAVDHPQMATVWLWLYDGTEATVPRLPAYDASGKLLPDGVRLGTVKLFAPSPTTPVTPAPALAEFGAGIRLEGYDLQQQAGQLSVALQWRCTAQVGADYTVFVHVVDSQGKLVAQHDSPPRLGRYPTYAWDPGELIQDSHPVDIHTLPPGAYQVQVGFYLPADGTRLPAHGLQSIQTLSDTVLLPLVIGSK